MGLELIRLAESRPIGLEIEIATPLLAGQWDQGSIYFIGWPVD